MFRTHVLRASAALIAGIALTEPASAAPSAFRMLYAFNAASSPVGGGPQGHLFYDYLSGSVVLIGAATYGGSASAGTVYTYNLSNGTVAVEAALPGPPGAESPSGGVNINLTKSQLGMIVGSAANGGANNDGALYGISSGGAYATAYSFGSVPNPNDPFAPLDGSSPLGILSQASNGNFYGTTSSGGAGAGGTIFQYNPVSNALNTIYTFNNTPGVLDGANPQEGLTLGPNGLFYGTTYGGGADGEGTIYSVSTSGVVATLYSFTGGNDGANPFCTVTFDGNGNMYGTAESGGRKNYGTLWELSSGGAFSVLHTFNNSNDGGAPTVGVTLYVQNAGQANSKNILFGVTPQAGANGGGTIFRYNLTTPGFGVAYAMNPATDGSNPNSQLQYGPGGALFGTNESGGANNNGTLFAYQP